MPASQHDIGKGRTKMRNKKTGFPDAKFSGEPRAKEEYASKRADGSINTHPQERMSASNRTGNRQG